MDVFCIAGSQLKTLLYSLLKAVAVICHCLLLTVGKGNHKNSVATVYFIILSILSLP